MGVNILTVVPPILDEGWRVALYPPATDFADAVADLTTQQLGEDCTIDPDVPPRKLSTYWVRGTADTLPDDAKVENDHGWRDVVSQIGTLVVLFRVIGPGIHNP